MNLIPNIKSLVKTGGVCNTERINWIFTGIVDDRIIRAAGRICEKSNGINVYIKHGEDNSEGYTITASSNEIKITSNGPAGAFYALMTLKMLRNMYKFHIPCCIINDAPDMMYRGFYQDTTRGRIPTLDTLKKLVDTMADYKMNSLQLYVEHSFDFKEYDHCKDELGYLTAEEICELDEYAKDRFIDLIPSLATFGHLYHLLQGDKYKHLCELSEYKPTEHYWKERMRHHTINPLIPESFELVTSLIDQHIASFSSNYFNICCDETFDLAYDVNKDKDKGRLYVDFVKKLIAYLEAKGKTVMMWGDIILQHPEFISELSENLIFLNWEYSKNPNEDKVRELSAKKQIVCPGTSSWQDFYERLDIEEDNITKLTEYGHKYSVMGILNTNWGDFGNPASIDMAMYGLILGASVSWNKSTEVDDEFRNTVSKYHYGSINAVKILKELGEIGAPADWSHFLCNWKYDNSSIQVFKEAQEKCTQIIDAIIKEDFKDLSLKKEFIIAACGASLIIKWSAAKFGYNIDTQVDFESWIDDYTSKWLENSKHGELSEMIRVLRSFNCGNWI